MADFNTLLNKIIDKSILYSEIESSSELKPHERDALTTAYAARQATEANAGIRRDVVKAFGTEADVIPPNALRVHIFPTGGVVTYDDQDISTETEFVETAPEGFTLPTAVITGTAQTYTWKAYY